MFSNPLLQRLPSRNRLRFTLPTLILFFFMNLTYAEPETIPQTTSAGTPDFGPNVLLFDPSSDPAAIKAQCDAIYARQERNQFGSERYAVLFKPGTYPATINVGYYTQIYGLGKMPGDVTIKGGVRSDARWMNGNATLNFWRGCENLAIEPANGKNLWAVSQAAPLRRVHVKGSLSLFDNGWSSGGFLADSKIDKDIVSGSQQQWFSRNSEWEAWHGSLWNMVFLGTVRPPAGSWPEKPYTTIDKTPSVAEKPFLYVDETGAYQVFVPAIRKETQGCSWDKGQPAGNSISLAKFHLARSDKDSASTLNEALRQGKNLLFTPGIYLLDDTLRVTRPDTVILGLGLATLSPVNGKPAMEVSDVGGVRLAGILFDAGTTSSPHLLQVGEPGSTLSHADNPAVLSDIFCRVGGTGATNAKICVIINSNDVIGDHAWIWRADHGAGTGWDSNKSDNGLIVNGNNVTYYGLFVEHFQQDQTLWNGENGRVYFYQCELPYDPPTQNEWKHGDIKGWPGYTVAKTVKSHEAWGLGLYCVFKKPDIYVDSAVESPNVPGVRFHNIVTVRLGGGSDNSGINSVINGTGAPATKLDSRERVMEYPTP